MNHSIDEMTKQTFGHLAPKFLSFSLSLIFENEQRRLSHGTVCLRINSNITVQIQKILWIIDNLIEIMMRFKMKMSETKLRFLLSI